MPAFETITGFAPGAAALNPAHMERVNHAADFIARSWDRAAPISSVRITGYIDRNEWQPNLGRHRALAVRDALINALGATRPDLPGRLRWIIEDRGLSPEAKVEIYLWAGQTPPPVPPLVRIPSPAEAARRTAPAVLRPRMLTREGYRYRPMPGAMEGFGAPTPVPDLILDDFDFDRAELKQKHKDQIAQLEQRIVDSWSPASTQPALGVRVVGHTDEAGSVEYNVDLGRRRAESVLRNLTGLIAGGDIHLYQRMTWSRTSEGKAHPRSSIPSQNRRVEIFIEWGRVRAPAPKPPPPPPPPPSPQCVAECHAQERRCLNETRFVPGCLIDRERCIRGCR
jgi:outer membrane protein OmpA-like peptidoglycan-associated protein